MGNNTEIELKLRFEDSSVWNRITEDAVLKDIPAQGSWAVEELETIYYDTPGRALQKKGYAYRIRRQGNEWVATMKGMGSSQGGLHQREEWSFTLTAPIPDISPFLITPAGNRIKDILGKEGLCELFRTVFKRKFIILKLPQNTRVEVAADLGTIVNGEKRLPISEIELELKDGCLGELLHLGAILSTHYGLLPEFNSKYHRGLVLSGFGSKNETITNTKGNPGDIISCIQQALLIQDRVVNNPFDQEGLKQLQVLFKKLQLFNVEADKDQFNFNKSLNLLIQKLEEQIISLSKNNQLIKIEFLKDNFTPLLLEMWAFALFSTKSCRL